MRSAQAENSRTRREANRARGRQRPHKRVRARAIIPGTRYKVTRRTIERRMFLMPDATSAAKLNNLVGYLLGFALDRYDCSLSAAVFEPNHPHIDLSDTEGQLPEFKAVFFGLLARGVNALRGRFDTVWSGDGGCDTQPCPEFVDESGDAFPTSQLGDLVYTLTNPVKDGLVKSGGRWPGFTTYGWKFGESREFERPDWFFDPATTSMPKTTSITLQRPPGVHPELSDAQLYEQLMGEVRERENYFRSTMRRENRRFMGEHKIGKQGWNRSPRSSEERFTVRPKVAGATRWERVAGIRRNRAWEASYATARERWLAGERDVEFPYGTYWLRVYVGVRTATAPP